MIREVQLYGTLAKKYGSNPIMIEAETTLLVMQGLFCKLGNGFKQMVREGQFHIYKDKPLKKDMGQEEVAFTLGSVTELHLVPVITGSGAIGRIIMGAALLVVGYFFPILAPYTNGIGLSMILGGAIELLSPTPKLTGTGSNANQAGQNPSFIFNGTVNVTEQGGPVPIILGRMRRASSVVLSAGLTVENLAP